MIQEEWVQGMGHMPDDIPPEDNNEEEEKLR
jgi:hypothetical protein